MLKELLSLSVLMWLCLFFFLPCQHEKKSPRAFIKGGFLIISIKRTQLFFPPLRLCRGLEAGASRVLGMVMLEAWWAEESLRQREDLPKPVERPDWGFLLP